MMRRFFRLTCLLWFLFVSGFVLLEAQSVSAAFKLQFESGATTVTIEDNGVQDLDPRDGVIVFIGAVGSFNVQMASGLSKPVVGESNVARLDLSVLTTNSVAASKLTISLTDTDFGPGGGDTTLTSTIGGTSNGATSFQSYLDPANAQFGTSCTSGPQGPFGGAFDSEVTGPCILGGPFSLTAVATVTGAGTQSFGASTSAPFEPPKCSIGDYVWEDADRNGCQDPEERPIEGVEVKLFEDCASPTEIASTTTNAVGFYEFTGLDCGKEYRVQFGDAGAIYERTLPFQDCSSTDPPEPSEANDSDCGQDDGFSGCVTFPEPDISPNNPTIDCGYVCEGKIGDYVWLDENEDGCQDEVNTGIAGVDVTLSEDCVDRENPQSVQTNPDGFYMFEGLCPGEYFVEFGNGRPNTNPGQSCDADPDVSEEKDSNCGDEALQCVELTRNNPEDPTIDCGKVGPCLELEKLVSGDGGITFFDADSCSDADVPFTVDDAEYKLVVTNCGKEAVDLDTIVDNDLGINLTLNPTVTIQPGDSVEFTNDAGQTAGLLQKVGACPNPDNQFENTATVSGTGAGSGDFVEATDPACVKCGPCVDLLKEVSVDGGVNWFDANAPDCSDGPTTSDPAEYRLTIENCGGEELVNLVIIDGVLDIDNLPVGQTLPVGGSIILTKAQIPALAKEDLCPLTPGDPGIENGFLRNIARVNADGETSGIPVSDEDPACVKCEEGEGCLSRTPGFWCTHDRVTELFLPVDSCGITLDNIGAANPGSAIEDLDFSGRDFNASDTSPQQLQLIRQCTAAALNFAASARAGGSCSDVVLSDGRTIDEVFAACCEDLCTSGASGPTISESNCIERLDEVNNLEPDTLTCESDPPAPFPFCPSLGANGFNATPATCEEANGNGFVNPGRNLGPRQGGGGNG